MNATIATPPVNIASHLAEMARLQPKAAALFVPGRGPEFRVPISFAQLDDRVNAFAHGLAARGVGPGTRTALCLRPGVDFFAVTFALFRLGAIPVLIDPGIGLKNFGRCIGQSRPEAFIGIPLVHLVRRALGWARGTIRTNITTGWFGGLSLRKWAPRPGDRTPPPPQDVARETAAILFTSGSTGPAKGVVYTHANFEAQIQSLKQTYGIQPGEIDLATFPLFGLFGPALGMAAAIPRMDFTRPGFVNPRNIIEPILSLGATNMFGSPALLDRVGRFGEKHGVKLPTLRRVISAGAPASAPVLARFAKMLSDDARIFTPYGATEALPVASIGSREILSETAALTAAGRGVCVGRPVENIVARAIRITDAPIATWADVQVLPAGEIGEIAVQGPAVTREYFERPDATSLAKIAEKDEGRFWHRMGDVGYFDAVGRLWFCGRKSQRVQLPAGDLFSAPVEGIFNTYGRAARTALVGVKRGGVMEPVICVELKPFKEICPPAVRLRLRDIRVELRELADQYPLTRPIRHFLFHPRFPVDIRHNAKINREQLAAWATRKLA